MPYIQFRRDRGRDKHEGFMDMNQEIKTIEGAKRVWVTSQNLRGSQVVEAQVQVKAGRRILAVYRTESSPEGFARCFEYAERFAAAHNLTVSDGEKY